jgi:hypothetical protein
VLEGCRLDIADIEARAEDHQDQDKDKEIYGDTSCNSPLPLPLIRLHIVHVSTSLHHLSGLLNFMVKNSPLLQELDLSHCASCKGGACLVANALLLALVSRQCAVRYAEIHSSLRICIKGFERNFAMESAKLNRLKLENQLHDVHLDFSAAMLLPPL